MKSILLTSILIFAVSANAKLEVGEDVNDQIGREKTFSADSGLNGLFVEMGGYFDPDNQNKAEPFNNTFRTSSNADDETPFFSPALDGKANDGEATSSGKKPNKDQ